MRKVWSIGIAVLALASVAMAQGAGQGAGQGQGQGRARATGSSKEVSWLGIAFMDVDADRAKALRLRETRGVEVTSVMTNSPAEKAGLKVNDVVLEFNGQRTDEQAELAHLVRETPPGKQVKLSIWRNGAPITVVATIGSNRMMESEGTWLLMTPPAPPAPPMSLPPGYMTAIDIPKMITIMHNSALGIEGESLAQEPQFAEFFGVKDGLLVKSVAQNSPAERAGMKAGDVVVKVGDTKIGNWRDLSTALRYAHSGQALAVAVVRVKKDVSLSVTLEER